MITLVMTVTIGTWIAKKFDLRLSLIPVLLLCGTITYGVCLLRSPVAFVIGNFLYYAVNALYLPFQQGILSDSGGPEDSGHLAGAVQLLPIRRKGLWCPVRRVYL